MDWSLLRPHVDPPLLRPELLYRNVVPVSKEKLVYHHVVLNGSPL